MERKGLTPSNDSIESDSFNEIFKEKAERNFDVSDHELGSALLAEEATTKSRFSWSLLKAAILASLCLVTVLSFGALSLIAPFYPHEVSSVINGEQFCCVFKIKAHSSLLHNPANTPLVIIFLVTKQ